MTDEPSRPMALVYVLAALALSGCGAPVPQSPIAAAAQATREALYTPTPYPVSLAVSIEPAEQIVQDLGLFHWTLRLQNTGAHPANGFHGQFTPTNNVPDAEILGMPQCTVQGNAQLVSDFGVDSFGNNVVHEAFDTKMVLAPQQSAAFQLTCQLPVGITNHGDTWTYRIGGATATIYITPRAQSQLAS